MHGQGEKEETEAGEPGCAGILWIHKFWKSELLLLQWRVLSSCLGGRGLSESGTNGGLGMHRGCVSPRNLQFSSSVL